MFQHWRQSNLFSLFLSQKNFNKKLTLKLIVLPLPKAMESTRNILASLSLQWWQNINVKDLHEHCIAAEVIDSRKAILNSGFSYVPHKLLFSKNCIEDDFRSKSLLLWKSIRLKSWLLYVLQYIDHRLFFLMPTYMWNFPDHLHLTTSLLQLLSGIDNA
jgi:hypothetical protein